MKTESKTTLQVLVEARETYATNPSHVPLTRPVESGKSCAVTAIGVGLIHNWSEAQQLALEALRKAIAGPGTCVVTWNAKHSTEEVLAAFDRAIEAEEAKQARDVVPQKAPRVRDNQGCVEVEERVA